eukprot:g3121.t1
MGVSDPINSIAKNRSWVLRHGREPNKNDSEIDRIKTHLEYALQVVSKSKNEKNSALINHLTRYIEAEQFPTNKVVLNKRNPIFIDRMTNTPCAVAYLMIQSGPEGEKLAYSIDQTHHTSYLYDIMKDENFADRISQWSSRNGFSVDQLALIQPGYTPVDTHIFITAVGFGSSFIGSKAL